MRTYRDALKPFRQHQAFMEDYIHHGIETNRKKFFRLRFFDGEGKPVPGVRVEVKQKNHAFHFGANCFMLGEFDSAARNREYEEQFKGLFNMATIPFYWRELEPVQGQLRFAKDSPRVYRRPAPDLCLEFCEQNGITPKAHCLVYELFTPDWVPNDLNAIKRLYEKRFSELARRYAHRIHGWEVINETLCWGRTVLAEQPDMVEWAFGLAEKYFPNNELIINETNGLWAQYHYNRSAYYMQIERALQKGARIDAVGLQWHMMMELDAFFSDQTPPYYNPMFTDRVAGLYGAFGRPLQITEITIPCYSDREEDEAIQAEILCNLYRLWFASPRMEALIYWNLIDGFAAYGPQGDFSSGENYFRGGLVRFDGTPKKGYYDLQNLIRSWRTDAQMETDADGLCAFKGFLGDYQLTAAAPDGRRLETELSFKREGGDSARLVLA